MPQSPLQNVQENGSISDELRRWLMSERQALIIRLGAIEDLLKMERSIVPRHKRRSDHVTAERENAGG
jgi:hypothetical protein